MKIKINKTTSSENELWLEIVDISEIVTGDTIEYIENSFVIKKGTPSAICKWKIVDKNNLNIIPRINDGVEFVNGQLPSHLYNAWNKSENNFVELMADWVNNEMITDIIN